jgi:hypothetical protein
MQRLVALVHLLFFPAIVLVCACIAAWEEVGREVPWTFMQCVHGVRTGRFYV